MIDTERLERIEQINVEEEMQRAFIDYSMSVIVSRALPDVRDGLKPGNRRILYAMRERGWVHNKAFVKCAKVVGEVIGNYHPHGDVAVYDTMVRMAQDFSMRAMLIDGQGNFGSIDGDPPAAYRYTECRLKPLAEEMLADIDKDTVDMRPNFDETLLEPVVLPARVPNLLVNGSTGIAVGMATNIPPHNLSEVVDALVHLIEKPEASIDELCHYIKGPDFPTGGVVLGLEPVRELYRTGRAKLKVRGRAGIEPGAHGKDNIIIREIPYALNKTNLIEKLAALVQEKKLEGITDIRDESGKEGIRVVIELRRGAIPKVVLNNIFKYTPLEGTFGAIMLALDKGRPRIMNLKEILERFLKHRLDVVIRRTKYELAKAEARAHILEGLKIALDHLDEVVRTIRGAANREAAKTALMAKFKLTSIQTDAILDMKLYQLTGLERDKIEQEYLDLIRQINYLRELLGSESMQFQAIKEDLLDIKKKYGEARRTDIVADEGEINIEDLIADERCVITVSNTGYIKRVPVSAYRQQRRGGRGVVGMETKETDYVEHVFLASTHDYLLCLTEKGRLYWVKVYDVPEGGRTARGKAIINLLEVGEDEKLAAMIRVREFKDDEFLVMATERGVVKKTCLAEYGNPRSGGIIAINIDEGDRLVGVKQTSGSNEIVLSSRDGKSIRFGEEALRDQGRATRGVRGINLEGNDVVVSIEVVTPQATLLVITENGYGKRTDFDEYRKQGRGGKGVITIKTSERNGKVVGAHAVHDNDALMLISQGGQMIRFAVTDLRVISRNTQGVRLINLSEGDHLISATTVEPDPEEIEEREDQPEERKENGQMALPLPEEEPAAAEDQIEE